MASTNFFNQALAFTSSPAHTINSTTSTRVVPITDKFELLQKILDLATTRPIYNLEIRGTHKSGRESVTDFDFQYDITQHLVRDATYIVVPLTSSSLTPSSSSSSSSSTDYRYTSASGPASRGDRDRDLHQEIRLDVAALTAYIDEADPVAPPPLSVESLVRWSTLLKSVFSRAPFGRGRAGISSTTRLDTAPTTRQIRALANRVAYGGHVTCTLRADKPSCDLVSFNSVYTPASQQCLHVRSVWKFIAVPDEVAVPTTEPTGPAGQTMVSTADDWEMLDPPVEKMGKGTLVPEWELDVQQAMACKKTDWLTDDDLALLVGLPVRALVHNLNLGLRDTTNCEEGEGERRRDIHVGGGGGVDQRLLWGCDE